MGTRKPMPRGSGRSERSSPSRQRRMTAQGPPGDRIAEDAACPYRAANSTGSSYHLVTAVTNHCTRIYPTKTISSPPFATTDATFNNGIPLLLLKFPDTAELSPVQHQAKAIRLTAMFLISIRYYPFLTGQWLGSNQSHCRSQ